MIMKKICSCGKVYTSIPEGSKPQMSFDGSQAVGYHHKCDCDSNVYFMIVPPRSERSGNEHYSDIELDREAFRKGLGVMFAGSRDVPLREIRVAKKEWK